MIWANPELKTSDWYRAKRHLVDIKQFLVALGFDIKNPPRIDDAFLTDLIGRRLRGSILIRKERVQDPTTGEWVDSDTERNEFRYWKKA
jgi:hypothetical protein